MTKSTKKAPPNVRRACIFCGAQDHKITKEHVAPRWISQLPTQQSGNQSTFLNKSIANNGFLLNIPADPKDPSPKANCVCEPCNTGWMARMEGKVRRICEMLLKHSGGTE